MVDLEQRKNRERRDGPSLVYRSRLADWRSCDRYRCYARSVSNTSGRPTCAPGFPGLVKGFQTFYRLKVDSDRQPSVSFSMAQNPHVSAAMMSSLAYTFGYDIPEPCLDLMAVQS